MRRSTLTIAVAVVTAVALAGCAPEAEPAPSDPPVTEPPAPSEPAEPPAEDPLAQIETCDDLSPYLVEYIGDLELAYEAPFDDAGGLVCEWQTSEDAVAGGAEFRKIMFALSFSGPPPPTPEDPSQTPGYEMIEDEDVTAAGGIAYTNSTGVDSGGAFATEVRLPDVFVSLSAFPPDVEPVLEATESLGIIKELLRL